VAVLTLMASWLPRPSVWVSLRGSTSIVTSRVELSEPPGASLAAGDPVVKGEALAAGLPVPTPAWTKLSVISMIWPGVGSGGTGVALVPGEPDATGEPLATGEPDVAGVADAAGEPLAAGVAVASGAATRAIEHVPVENRTELPAVSTTAVSPEPLSELPPPPVVGGSVAVGEPRAPPVVVVAVGVALDVGGSVFEPELASGDEFAAGPQAATSRVAAAAPAANSLFPPTGASFRVSGRDGARQPRAHAPGGTAVEIADP